MSLIQFWALYRAQTHTHPARDATFVCIKNRGWSGDAVTRSRSRWTTTRWHCGGDGMVVVVVITFFMWIQLYACWSSVILCWWLWCSLFLDTTTTTTAKNGILQFKCLVCRRDVAKGRVRIGAAVVCVFAAATAAVVSYVGRISWASHEQKDLMVVCVFVFANEEKVWAAARGRAQADCIYSRND